MSFFLHVDARPRREYPQRMFARLTIVLLITASLLSGCVLKRIVNKGEVEHHPMSEQDRREATASQKVSEALSMFHEGDFLDRENAIGILTEAVHLDPENFDARFYRGLAYLHSGLPQPAERDLKKAVDIKPSDAKARYLLGYTLFELGKSQEAIKALTGAIEKNPSFSEAYAQRATIHSRLGDHERAIEDYHQSIALAPGAFDPWFSLGVALLELKRYDEAYRAFSEAMSLRPDSGAAFEGRARALTGLGRFEEAARDMHFALSINPENTELRALYAEALEKSGDKGGALREYRRAEAQFSRQGETDDAARMNAAIKRLTP